MIVFELVESRSGVRCSLCSAQMNSSSVLVRNDVGRRRRQAAKQVIDDRAQQLSHLARKIDHAVGRKEITSAVCAPWNRSRLIACSSSGSKVVVTKRSKSVICDELPQRVRRREVRVAGSLRTRVYASSRRPREARNQQTTSLSVYPCGSSAGSTFSRAGELLGDPVVEQARPAFGLDLQQLRAR